MLSNTDKKMIRMIIDNYHVSTSNKTIMRNFYDRMKGKLYLYNRELRREVYQCALECHKQNRELYSFVMS